MAAITAAEVEAGNRAAVYTQVAAPLATEEDVQRIYNWIDEIPLSRPKRNISRDFADGLLCAEIAHYFFPGRVDMHNYSSVNSLDQKRYNWNTLNVKVLKKIGFMIHPSDIERAIKAEPGAVERVLAQMMTFLQDRARSDRLQESVEERPKYSPESARSHQVNTKASGGGGGYPKGGGGGETGGGGGGGTRERLRQEADAEILVEKEHTIHELRETVMIMSEKIRKLEQLVRIKDTKIDNLNTKLERAKGGGQ